MAWLVLGAEGAEMFGEATLGFYGSKNMVRKVSVGLLPTLSLLETCQRRQSGICKLYHVKIHQQHTCCGLYSPC